MEERKGDEKMGGGKNVKERLVQIDLSQTRIPQDQFIVLADVTVTLLSNKGDKELTGLKGSYNPRTKMFIFDLEAISTFKAVAVSLGMEFTEVVWEASRQIKERCDTTLNIQPMEIKPFS